MKNLNEMSDSSRVWIYQANRFLTNEECSLIKRKLDEFIDQWSSHGLSMDAAGDVLHNRFLIVAADESRAAASGCGIDKSVRFVQEISASSGIDFFQRTTVIYRQGGQLLESPIHEFWARRKAGLVNDETLLFDNTVRTYGDMKTAWEAPFSRTWHNEMWAR